MQPATEAPVPLRLNDSLDIDAADLPFLANEGVLHLEAEEPDAPARRLPGSMGCAVTPPTPSSPWKTADHRTAAMTVLTGLLLFPFWYGGLYVLAQYGRSGANMLAIALLAFSIVDAMLALCGGLYFLVCGDPIAHWLGMGAVVCVGVNVCLALAALL
eukprot:GGOE01018593.1.p2 GENE.GGOE01018593.1~~GGOE01018593.1.p2  ORF type:complete len:158 (+),score=38.45 GGOE01018593.1:75-548(+)